MKKILVVFVGLLLMFSYGCSSDDAKKSAEKTKEAVIETTDKAAEVNSEAVTATKETAVEVKDKTVDMTKDAVKAPKKKPAIEGC